MRVIEQAEMARFTSFRAGGTARRLVTAENTEELKNVLDELARKGEPHVFLGNGTNTIFADGCYEGTVVTLGEAFGEIEVTEAPEGQAAGEAGACGTVRAGAAALLSRVARAAAAKGLGGFEFAAGIPGSIGGAVFMNAGAYGGEIKDVLVSVTALVPEDGAYVLKEIPAGELELGYRTSRLQRTGEIVVSAELALPAADRADIEAKMAELAKKRSDKQPLEFPSAGSFFKRPEGDFAGRLIEEAGCKGLAVGGAQISEKHAGFMINRGGATAQDIIDLMHLVQNTVFDKSGRKLEPEVRIIGYQG